MSAIGPIEADPPTLREALARAQASEVELRRQVAELERQLQTKNDRLTEVNHRAKNNLQMAMAMLSMQAMATDDERIAAALQGAANRLSYLARVHELLHQRGDDRQEIAVDAFIRDICDALAEAYRRDDIEVRCDVEPLKLDVDRAISVGLIVGEAVMNSFKYGYRDGNGGRIEVACRGRSGKISLVIRDDGAGFPVAQRRGSLGMRLLRALGRSLGGETHVRSRSGTEVKLIFPLIARPPA